MDMFVTQVIHAALADSFFFFLFLRGGFVWSETGHLYHRNQIRSWSAKYMQSGAWVAKQLGGSARRARDGG